MTNECDIFIKECSVCLHRNVCKYRDAYEKGTAELKRYLESISNFYSIPKEIVEVYITCKKYSAEYQVALHTTPYVDNPIRYTNIPGGTPTFDLYKITCTGHPES